MNRRLPPLSCILYFGLQIALFAALTPQREKEMRSKFGRAGGFAFDVRKLSDEEKSFLASLAREQIAKDPFEGGGTNVETPANETLVMLGDKEATERFLAHYRETGRNPEPLLLSYNPKIIEALIPDLFQNDPWPMADLGGDQPVMPPSYRVCLVIEILLRSSPSFSKEVNDWGIRNFRYDPRQGSKSMLEHRTLLRKWWKENERFFKAGDYKSVKPGDELFGPSAAINLPENPQTPIAPSAPPASTPDQHSTAGVKAPSTSRFAFSAFFIALAVLFAGLLIIRKGTRK
jgi:hypothetical protein